MEERAFNFSAGPATLPTEVLTQVAAELLNYRASGASIMELSHRGPEFEEVLCEAEAKLRKLMKLPDTHAILFLQGGASLQFAMVPMNFCLPGRPVDLVHTGYWTMKAINELKQITEYRIIASGEEDGFSKLPKLSTEMIHEDACYLHYCSNNTIYGTQWKNFVQRKGVRTVVDMSSDFLSRPLKFESFDLIFAGAQKNVGPSGLAVVIVDKNWAQSASEEIPHYLRYQNHIDQGSRFHTPNTFGIYIAGLVFDWIEQQGGLSTMQSLNEAKANLLYETIDKLDVYDSPVEKSSRSQMNVLFRINKGDEALEQKFLQNAKEKGLIGLKAHRHTGGIRASLYNALPLKGVEKLVEFMQEFKRAL